MPTTTLDISSGAYATGLARGGSHAELLRAATLAVRDNGVATVDVESPAWRELSQRAAKRADQQARAAKYSWGPSAWERLHRWAMTFDGDATEGRAWIDAWLREDVRCGDCRRHFREALDGSLAFETDRPFEWSVKAHNAVNARLGKPQVMVEAAREQWAA